VAKCTYALPYEFLLKISSLADRTDEIVPRVLEAGADVVLQKTKSNLKAVVGKTKYKSRATGELVSALGVSPAKLDKNGDYNVKIGFAEPRRGGGSNAKIANILEYGKSGQPPRPFLKPAKSASKNAVIDTMTAKLEEEINNI